MPFPTCFRIGARVHIRGSIAGDPGCVTAYHGDYIQVFWPEIDIVTAHAPDDLVEVSPALADLEAWAVFT